MSPGHRITDWSAQSFVQLVLKGIESLQQWRLHSFSRQVGPGLIAVMVTAIYLFFFNFPLANQALPCSFQDHCHLSCFCAPSHKVWLCLLKNLPSGFSKAPTRHHHGKHGPEDLFQNCLIYLHQHWNTC